ncbi:MAG: hypothetical protein ACI88H_003372 [Cocleimonas sp.]|jgi:uncharacterized protein YhhL (DUF1145 family)
MSNLRTNAHWAFWVIAILGLLWNVGGIMNYMMQMKPDYIATVSETQRAIIEGRPAWATGGFAIGVFGGALGCSLLLLRKPIAGLVFMVSLMGIFVTMIHTLQIVMAKSSFSVTEIFVMIILPIVVANFLIGFTVYAMKRNWISQSN